jgi:hypothetical protein
MFIGEFGCLGLFYLLRWNSRRQSKHLGRSLLDVGEDGSANTALDANAGKVRPPWCECSFVAWLFFYSARLVEFVSLTIIIPLPST